MGSPKSNEKVLKHFKNVVIVPKSLTLMNTLEEATYTPKMGMRNLKTYEKKKGGKKQYKTSK